MRNHLSAIIVLYPLCALSSWTFPRDYSAWGLSLGWWMYLAPWGFRMRAGMKLIFDEFFFFIVVWVNHFMGHLQPRIENGYCACMPKICLFLLIKVWPGNHLIGNILLATAWNWLYCTPDIFLFVVLPFVNWTLSACHQLIFRETSPCIFFSCKFLWNHECLSNQRNGLVLAQTITFQMITVVCQRLSDY